MALQNKRTATKCSRYCIFGCRYLHLTDIILLKKTNKVSK